MRKIIVAVFSALFAFSASAQNFSVREEVLANLDKTAGMESPYIFDVPALTAAPKGYKPFYISHYGRHGSRYAWSPAFYTEPLKLFTDAHNEGQLTELGERIYADMVDFVKVPIINYGDLVPLGWYQHEKIAQTMYASFPEVFSGKGKKVEAVVSTSSRAIVSMSSFCLALKGCNPELEFYQSSTHTGMMVAAPSSAPAEIRENYKGFDKDYESLFETRSEFGNRIGNYREISERLFKDPDFPDRYEGGQHEFYYHFFGLRSGYHNYEERPLFDIFTPDEMFRLWEINNYSSYLYDIQNRWKNIPLLKDVLAKADAAIRGEGNAADLRFGHDYVIEAFNVLINIDGSGIIPEKEDDVKYWKQSFTIPKAANDQFVFYRSKKGGDILFKLLVNGVESRLPQLEAVSGPYYRWDDFKVWAEGMLAEHPLIPKETDAVAEAEGLIHPAPLQPGDSLALICPSGPAYDSLKVLKAKSVIESWGYKVAVDPSCFAEWNGCAGTPEQRRASIENHLQNPEIKGLICYRGGHGSISAMKDIPLGMISRNPKWLVGYSDISTMLSCWNSAGVVGIHGNVGSHFAECDSLEEATLLVRKMLAGDLPVYDIKTAVEGRPANRPGHAEGCLVGGNFETLQPSMGTDMDALSLDRDLVLFIEDVNENIVHMERRLLYMKLHGMLRNVKAVICGYFTEYEPDSFKSMEDMLDYHLAPMGIPVVYGFPAGHSKPNMPLLMGSQVSIDVTPDSVHMEFR